MTIIEKINREIELHDGKDYQKILDTFSNLDQHELSEIAIFDIDQLTHSYRLREHYRNLKLEKWNEFSNVYNCNILEYIFNSVGYYINLILYRNEPSLWCSWVSNFCDYVKASFIQCLLRFSTSHIDYSVDYSTLLEMTFEQNNHSLARFLIYAYICDDIILNNSKILCHSNYIKNVISVIVPILSDISHPLEIKRLDGVCNVIIKSIGAQIIVSKVHEFIKGNLYSNKLKGEFRLWANCLSMTSCAQPDHEFSELYCQWLENLLNDVNLTYDFITSDRMFQNPELSYTILITHCLNEQAIEHVKSIFPKSFSPYGGWSDLKIGWKRNQLFQHSGLLLCAFGIKETANDDLINFVCVLPSKIDQCLHTKIDHFVTRT